MANKIEKFLAAAYRCERCQHHGAKVERLAMAGTGISRWFEIQKYRYAFVSCTNCGHTEIFSLNVLEGKDSVGTFLEVLFAD